MPSLNQNEIFTPAMAYIRNTLSIEQINNLHKRGRSLPKTLFRILNNFDVAEIMYTSLRNKFNLNVNQLFETSLLIGQMILGEIFIGNAVQYLSEKIKVNINDAKAILDEILSTAFTPEAIVEFKDIQKKSKKGFHPEIEPETPEFAPVIQSRPVNQNNVLNLRDLNK